MTKLTAGKVAGYAARAGFTGTGLQRAVAVALAESGGDTTALHVNADSYRSRDRGLWQINSHWHPEVSDAAAYDPAQCAAAAYRISKAGADWSAWSTWHNGAAQAQLGRAQLGIAQAHNAGWLILPGPGGSPIPLPVPVPGTPPGIMGDPLGISDTLGAAKAAIALAEKAGGWIADPHNWVRVAMVAGGVVGTILALDMIAQSGAAGSTARGAAKTVTKAAALAAVA